MSGPAVEGAGWLGDVFGGVEVVDIRPDTPVVQFAQRRLTLTLDRPWG